MMSNSAPNAAGGTGSPVPNPFDPNLLKVTPNLGEMSSKEIITRVPVGRPSNQTYFRVNAAPEYQLDTSTIKWTEDRQVYLIAPECRKFLANESKIVRLYFFITDSGTIGLWDVGLPTELGRTSVWFDTAHAAAKQAMTQWVRISSDLKSNCYRVFPHVHMKEEPAWPELTFSQVLELAFSGRFINTPEHPIIKRLMGLS